MQTVQQTTRIKKVIHRNEDRGYADHGWLKAKHSFSFGSWFNPDKMGFGLLRVINDDRIAGGAGFGTHPHENMEIITVPLKGVIMHKDSEGNEESIRHGEVQAMSAGTGVYHSEYNGSATDELNIFQIWVLPKKQNIAPRYDQKEFSEEGRKNQFQSIVSPIGTNNGSVEINQDAYFHLADLDQGKSLSYELKQPGNGIYLIVIEGELEIAGESLKEKDAIGISELSGVDINSSKDAKFLVMEVPMN